MKKHYRLIGILIIAAAVICAAVGIWKYMQEEQAGEVYTGIRKESYVEEMKDRTQESQPPEKEPVQIPIDFTSLQAQNPDVYAWIIIPGTQIDYPVLQSRTDDTWYLTHTIDGEEKTEGAIFTESCNNRNFEDPNTVIYGHNMRNGSMFRDIHNYQDHSFFDNNREVIIYTPDAIRHYKIFAAYLYDNRHLIESFDCTDKGIYRAYLNMVFSIRDMNAHIDTSMDVGTDDKIITLSTCYGTRTDRRYLVQAVLESIEQ